MAKASNINDGLKTIEKFVKTLPGGAGVYRMLDDKGNALYIGKAKNLKKRVASYTNANKLSYRLQRMVSETTSMEFIRTHTEAEALLLEANLIKKLKPKYNILLRDDKSFPYILITDDHDFPQVTKHRGARKHKGSYFGPFASVGAVNRTLTILQKGFMLRNCSDNVFSARTRPCLQYQIKRCTAPCVGYVTKSEYAEQVKIARDFLEGKSQKIQKDFAKKMQAASDALDFETAASYRDRIKSLTTVQAHQAINVEGVGDADIMAVWNEGGVSCIQVFFFRAGSNYGNRSYFPAHTKEASDSDILSAFIGQFYANKPVARQLLLSTPVPEKELLENALSIKAERKVTVTVPRRGAKKELVEHVLANAKEAHARRLSTTASQAKLLEGIADIFDLDAPPERIEVYDNSHISGTNQIGAMIVATSEGFTKNAYRKFNIKSKIAPGDDYAMMREVITRRFARALKENPDRDENTWPDLVMIDGGQGQLSAVQEALEELGITDLPIVAIAKGPDRNAGREKFFIPGRAPFSLGMKDPMLYFIQRLRDEAHRFAIDSHRAKRTKTMVSSPLDGIPGIGPTRKKALLHHFGSGKAVANAGLPDLEAVEGISRAVAQQIYDYFHEDR